MPHKTYRFPIAACGLLLALSLSCRQNEPRQSADQAAEDRKWNREQAQVDYELVQAELRLAKSTKPYMVLDVHNKELLLKLKGAVVWGYPMDIAEADSEDVLNFVERFLGNRKHLIRPLAEKHLFSASEKTPDSILAIVGEAVNVNPDLLQRLVPQRFQLLWNHGLILEVRTDAPGKSTSRFKNTFFEVRRALQKPFGESYIVVKMSPDEALTLYRASRPGLPTLIYPPR